MVVGVTAKAECVAVVVDTHCVAAATIRAGDVGFYDLGVCLFHITLPLRFGCVDKF